MELIRKHAEKIRFAAVGGLNTGLDFAILFVLVWLGLDKIVGNYISTGITFVISFFLNRSFTFKSTGGNLKRQIIGFVVVTIIGIWIIQPVVILGVSHLIASFALNESVTLFIAKLVATVASLIWNYLLYSRVVFKKEVK